MKMNRIQCSHLPYRSVPYSKNKSGTVLGREENQKQEPERTYQEPMRGRKMKTNRINCRNMTYKPFSYFLSSRTGKAKEEIVMQTEYEEPEKEEEQVMTGYMQPRKIKTNYVKCSHVVEKPLNWEVRAHLWDDAGESKREEPSEEIKEQPENEKIGEVETTLQSETDFKEEKVEKGEQNKKEKPEEQIEEEQKPEEPIGEEKQEPEPIAETTNMENKQEVEEILPTDKDLDEGHCEKSVHETMDVQVDNQVSDEEYDDIKQEQENHQAVKGSSQLAFEVLEKIYSIHEKMN